MILAAEIALFLTIGVSAVFYLRWPDNNTLKTLLIFLVFSGLNFIATRAGLYPENESLDYSIQFIANLLVHSLLFQQIYFGYFNLLTSLAFGAVVGIFVSAVYVPLSFLGSYTTAEVALGLVSAILSLIILIKLFRRVHDTWCDYRTYILLGIFLYSSGIVAVFGVMQYLSSQAIDSIQKDRVANDLFGALLVLSIISYLLFTSAFVVRTVFPERRIHGARRFLLPPKLAVLVTRLNL